jgi:hypothetical protein
MATLTDSARVSRLVIKWGIVGLFGLMIGRTIVGALITWYKETHPVIPPPTLGFGTLPSVSFPTSTVTQQLTYHLETVTGHLPTMPTQADVLVMGSSRPNLLAMERSIADAAALGFKTQPEKVSDLVYRWRMTDQIPSSLTMKIYDGRFVWDTAWSTNPNFLVEKALPSQADAVKEALGWMKRINDTAEDVTTDTATVSYLKGIGGEYQTADSLSDADFIQIDLFRKEYKDSYTFVTPRADQGVVRVILSGNPRIGRVARMEYNYFPADYTTVETYPLRPIDQAWDELQAGKGFIAQLDAGVSDVTVRKITLGYFDSFEPQKYMQPVYVFTGDNHFVGYVQAVKDAKAIE